MKHPGGNDDRYARFGLNDGNVSARAPFGVQLPDLAAMPRVPAVIDFNVLVDMSRMDPRWLWDADHGCSPVLIAVACGLAPEGRARWTVELLADRVVRLKIVERCSTETVRRTLKKNELKPWQKKMWCIPPEADAEFACAMENVLEVYKRPYDPKRPVICLDGEE